MKIDLDAHERTARAATQGEWNQPADPDLSDEDAAHIAANSPKDAVLS